MATSIPEAMTQALAHQQRRPAIETAGVQALHRLTPIALGYTGQSRVVGRFLLGLYNGYDFPFALHDLRSLDLPVFEDCLKVLMMDFSPELEVHERIENGDRIFDQLMAKWAPEVAVQ